VSSKQQVRDQQREARKAALQAAQAKAQRVRQLQVVGVVIAVLAIFGVVAAFALKGGGDTTDANGTAYSADREAFYLPGLLDDNPVALADHAGTPVVVNFFASWCVYCNEELPGFVQVAQAAEGQVDFIGVDTSDPGDGAAMARRFALADAGFALAKDIGADPASDLWRTFGGQGLPVTAFYDANGKLVDFSGGMLTQAELQQRLSANFGIDVTAPDATELGSPVIPLIPQGAMELLGTHAGDPTFVAVDLRPADADAAQTIPGAINLPAGDGFAASYASLDKASSYFLFDQDGSSAEAAAGEMFDAGFKHVYFIQGGFDAWTSGGFQTT
jgi:thiol-disulfide isomerase/thioredoxin/rhodanese-related sulfurtransferase